MAAMIALAVVLGLSIAGMAPVIYGTVKKNRWGVNLNSASCPRCGAPIPRVRTPRSLHQVMWGGSTCGICGTEVDKWGREVAAPASNENKGSEGR
jgi:hypothetical protein